MAMASVNNANKIKTSESAQPIACTRLPADEEVGVGGDR